MLKGELAQQGRLKKDGLAEDTAAGAARRPTQLELLQKWVLHAFAEESKIYFMWKPIPQETFGKLFQKELFEKEYLRASLLVGSYLSISPIRSNISSQSTLPRSSRGMYRAKGFT